MGTQVVPEKLEQQAYNSEISQLMSDESVRYEVYEDSLGKRTIGFGHLMTEQDNFIKITPEQALLILRSDYALASRSVDLRYKWASGDVRLILINMTFQMGATGVSKFKNMLKGLQDKDYDKAAAEMLDSKWSRQTPHRSIRLAGRILRLESSWW